MHLESIKVIKDDHFFLEEGFEEENNVIYV